MINWPPHLTVACIVERDNKFLIVEEIANDMVVYNQPAGHLDPGETMQQAAIRETYEETGWHIEPTHVLGFSRYLSPYNHNIYYRTTFIGSAISHDPHAKLDEGIIRALWLSLDELRAEPGKLRSPLVLKNIEQYLAGQRYPLSLIDDNV